MRAFDSQNGIQLKAYAGSTAVLLAMNVTEKRRSGLLGFAIERRDQEGQHRWLQGLLRFPGQEGEPLTSIDSRYAPIQKFRWSDYSVYPDMQYSYRVNAAYAKPGFLTLERGPELRIRTRPTADGEHQVVFNRAAAASQAYSRRFGNTNPDSPPNDKARKWLSRGLLEKILSFINRAQSQLYAIDVAIYEIELPEIVDSLLGAIDCGAKVRVVYHAKTKDEQTEVNEDCLHRLPDSMKVGRRTSSIFHQKFIVLSHVGSDGARSPKSVLTGTTNFTLNGVFRQANMVHVIDNPEVAKEYLDLFNLLFSGADVRQTKKYINDGNPIVDARQKVVFSPRSAFGDTKEVCSILKSAASDVVFCTTFDLHPDVVEALIPKQPDNVIRYGVQNKRSKVEGIHRGESYPAPAYLNDGLEGFLKESTAGQKGNILVHLKSIVTDFTTDHPTVVTGSNNFSRPSSEKNDENMFILRGNTGVADTYVCEMMRIYDHYRFRYNTKTESDQKKPQKPLVLDKDDQWTDSYFVPGSKKALERERFCTPTS